MERLNNINKIENNTIVEDRERIFDNLIKKEIFNTIIEDLENAGFEQKEIDEFLEQINNFDETSIKGILSMPQELRKRNFPKYKKLIENGETNIRSILQKMDEMAKKNSYTLGYHASKIDIPKNGDRWDIKATELDDRDDRLMAYYSLDYKDIYRVDRGTKLYVIRAQIGENTTHKVDNNNKWGRADSLSIVHKMDLIEIDKQVEEKLNKLKDAKQKDAA